MLTELTVPSDPADEEEFLAAPSFAQERLWVMEQMEDGTSTYNIQMGLRLRGRLDTRALQDVLDEILRRHETLRTRLVLEDGELVQVIAASGTTGIRHADLTDRTDPEAAWRVAAERELHSPFDMSAELPLRAALLRLADDHHVLLVTLDHLACDARSVQVLHTELVTLYPAFASGAPSPLPELPVQYADYAAWQRQWLEGDEQRRQLEHWRGRLGGELPRLTFHRRSDAGAHRSGTPRNLSRTHRLPEGLVLGLEELARREGTSLFTVLLSAFGTLVGRYGSQEDFVVGSLLGGRTRPELDNLIGFFVNTVGLRLDLRGGPVFSELLARVHEVTLDAYAHQDVPFEQVVREFAPPPAEGQGHSRPFFDVMFQLADLNMQSVRLPGLSLEPLVMANEPAPIDLVVAVLQEDGAHTCVWDFHTDLFSEALIDRMQRQFVALLTAVTADPHRPLSDLKWVTAQETEALIGLGEGTGPEGGPGPEAAPGPNASEWTFVRHFADVAARFPDRPALADGGRHLTYRELDKRANRLAHVLSAQGVGPDLAVGIFLPRGIDQVVTTLAILKAGAAFLPLDPAYPADRITYMLDDAAPPLVLTSRALDESLPRRHGTATLLVEDLAADVATAPGTPRAVATRADHLAYVIYTSGSTGRPKGTGVPHRGMRVVIEAMASVLGLTSEDRVLSFASASFDASVFEILMAFGAGASLHVAPADRGVPEDLTRFLRDERITALVLPPSALAALVEDAALPDLRTIAVAGEACPPAVAARWADGRRFFNLYGPTEATIWSTWQQVTGEYPAGVPIGRPLPSTAVRLLGEDLRPVPAGVPGELYVGGPVVARGYLGRPALTAERFVPDPFGPSGARLYRTGDLARWNEEGGLDFLGRTDDQVKIRGFRIELGEIDRTIAAHPGIREAVAVVREHAPGMRAVVAYAVARSGPDSGPPPAPKDLHELCVRSLPSYMVPTHVVLLDRLPLTGSGKIDRRALPAPALGGGSDVPGAALDGPLEEAMAAIWAEVLGVEVHSRTDDFFALGGNSLSATQVIVQVRQDFELALPVRTLFDSAELHAFTEAVRATAQEQEQG